jgi:predicted nuclease with RNAse H fold
VRQLAAYLHRVPGATTTISIGIDVAEPRKGLDLVALDDRRSVVASHGRLTVEDVARLTMTLRPAVVCVDSPSGWSTSGRSRSAERELARIGIQSYRTGPDPGDHPFYRWIRVGFELFRQVAPAYPLYRSGAVAGTAAEVFPHASACLLAGELRAREMPKDAFRRAALRSEGVPEDQLPTPDRVDAALAALTGVIALAGAHTAVGDPNEGVVLLPVASVPITALSRALTRR